LGRYETSQEVGSLTPHCDATKIGLPPRDNPKSQMALRLPGTAAFKGRTRATQSHVDRQLRARQDDQVIDFDGQTAQMGQRWIDEPGQRGQPLGNRHHEPLSQALEAKEMPAAAWLTNQTGDVMADATAD
jgi:hypothetical protein